MPRTFVSTLCLSEIEKKILKHVLPKNYIIEDEISTHTALVIAYRAYFTPKYVQALEWGIPVVHIDYIYKKYALFNLEMKLLDLFVKECRENFIGEKSIDDSYKDKKTGDASFNYCDEIKRPNISKISSNDIEKTALCSDMDNKSHSSILNSTNHNDSQEVDNRPPEYALKNISSPSIYPHTTSPTGKATLDLPKSSLISNLILDSKLETYQGSALNSHSFNKEAETLDVISQNESKNLEKKFLEFKEPRDISPESINKSNLSRGDIITQESYQDPIYASSTYVDNEQTYIPSNVAHDNLFLSNSPKKNKNHSKIISLNKNTKTLHPLKFVTTPKKTIHKELGLTTQEMSSYHRQSILNITDSLDDNNLSKENICEKQKESRRFSQSEELVVNTDSQNNSDHWPVKNMDKNFTHASDFNFENNQSNNFSKEIDLLPENSCPNMLINHEYEISTKTNSYQISQKHKEQTSACIAIANINRENADIRDFINKSCHNKSDLYECTFYSDNIHDSFSNLFNSQQEKVNPSYSNNAYRLSNIFKEDEDLQYFNKIPFYGCIFSTDSVSNPMCVNFLTQLGAHYSNNLYRYSDFLLTINDLFDQNVGSQNFNHKNQPNNRLSMIYSNSRTSLDDTSGYTNFFEKEYHILEPETINSYLNTKDPQPTSFNACINQSLYVDDKNSKAHIAHEMIKKECEYSKIDLSRECGIPEINAEKVFLNNFWSFIRKPKFEAFKESNSLDYLEIFKGMTFYIDPKLHIIVYNALKRLIIMFKGIRSAKITNNVDYILSSLNGSNDKLDIISNNEHLPKKNFPGLSNIFPLKNNSQSQKLRWIGCSKTNIASNNSLKDLKYESDKSYTFHNNQIPSVYQKNKSPQILNASQVNSNLDTYSSSAERNRIFSPQIENTQDQHSKELVHKKTIYYQYIFDCVSLGVKLIPETYSLRFSKPKNIFKNQIFVIEPKIYSTALFNLIASLKGVVKSLDSNYSLKNISKNGANYYIVKDLSNYKKVSQKLPFKIVEYEWINQCLTFLRFVKADKFCLKEYGLGSKLSKRIHDETTRFHYDEHIKERYSTLSERKPQKISSNSILNGLNISNTNQEPHDFCQTRNINKISISENIEFSERTRPQKNVYAKRKSDVNIETIQDEQKIDYNSIKNFDLRTLLDNYCASPNEIELKKNLSCDFIQKPINFSENHQSGNTIDRSQSFCVYSQFEIKKATQDSTCTHKIVGLKTESQKDGMKNSTFLEKNNTNISECSLQTESKNQIATLDLDVPRISNENKFLQTSEIGFSLKEPQTCNTLQSDPIGKNSVYLSTKELYIDYKTITRGFLNRRKSIDTHQLETTKKLCEKYEGISFGSTISSIEQSLDNKTALFQFTGLSKEKKDLAIYKLNEIGVKFIDSEKFHECTHLIMGKFTYSDKFICSLSRGAWILSERIIYDLDSEVDLEKYEWNDAETTEDEDLTQSSRIDHLQNPDILSENPHLIEPISKNGYSFNKSLSKIKNTQAVDLYFFDKKNCELSADLMNFQESNFKKKFKPIDVSINEIVTQPFQKTSRGFKVSRAINFWRKYVKLTKKFAFSDWNVKIYAENPKKSNIERVLKAGGALFESKDITHVFVDKTYKGPVKEQNTFKFKFITEYLLKNIQ